MSHTMDSFCYCSHNVRPATSFLLIQGISPVYNNAISDRLHSLGQAVLALCRFITGADLVIIKQIIFANLCWRKVWHNDISSCENSLFPSGGRNRTEGGCCREKYFRQHKTNQSKQIKCQFQRSGRFIQQTVCRGEG